MAVIFDECEVCRLPTCVSATHESDHRHSTLAMYAIFHNKRFENLTQWRLCQVMRFVAIVKLVDMRAIFFFFCPANVKNTKIAFACSANLLSHLQLIFIRP